MRLQAFLVGDACRDGPSVIIIFYLFIYFLWTFAYILQMKKS